MKHSFDAKYNEKGIQNYFSRLKVVVSGTSFEFYEFDHPIFYGPKQKKSKEDNQPSFKLVMSEEEKATSSARRAKSHIKRLIKTNAFNWFNEKDKPYLPITLTLTFAEDIRDVKEANNLFSNFIQRLNYSVNLVERGWSKKEAKKNILKYTVVIEFQDKTRGGVVHYHVIFYNLPKMERIYDRLNDIWGKGFFWVGEKKKRGKNSTYVRDHKKLDKIIDYFIRYISKSFGDKRLWNKKTYFNSRGLIKPTVIVEENLVDMIFDEVPKEALQFKADNLKYPYKAGERSFNYKKFDLADFPEEMNQALKLAKMY